MKSDLLEKALYYSNIDLLKYLEKIVQSIPEGKVTTISEVAKALGDIRASRWIGRVLTKIDGPIHRVLYSDFRLGAGGQDPLKQREILESEGIDYHEVERYFTKPEYRPEILKELRKLQVEVASRVREERVPEPSLIGGVDLSYRGNVGYAVFVVLDSNLRIVEKVISMGKVSFPYIPTYLAFREFPLIYHAWRKLELKPDVTFVNGHGLSHPVKCGLATFSGVLLDTRTVGVAKKHLFGRIKDNCIYVDGKKVGAILKRGSKVNYVSIGNRVDINFIEKVSRYWIQGNYVEPIRLADEISKRIRI